MKLGIIGDVNEKSFKSAADRGLDFLEFCVNVGTDPNAVFADMASLKGWIKEYKIGVQSIGRWGSDRLDAAGKPIAEEAKACQKLVDVAVEVGCPNFICGCNFVKGLTLLDNCKAAADFMSSLMAYAKPKGVRIAVYNCRWNYIVDPATWSLIHQQLPELGIKYDPSHARYNGGDYLGEMMEWGQRFYHVHLKGSLIIAGKRFDDPPAGLDQTDWRSFMALLYAKKYTGGLSIEPHSANWRNELGEKGLDYTVAYFKKLLF